MGKEGDATPFADVTVDNISSALHRCGFPELRPEGHATANHIVRCHIRDRLACHPCPWMLPPAGFRHPVASDAAMISKCFDRCGYQSRGWEVMYNGHTGKRLQAQIFLNPTYYQRLKHMVSIPCKAM